MTIELKDLHFSKPDHLGTKRARHTFPNGYTISVIIGEWVYSNGVNDYEIAIMKYGEIMYDTGLTGGDVLGYQSKKDVNKILKQVEALP